MTELLEYTDWERQEWLRWMSSCDRNPLSVSAGPHADRRFTTVGEVVRHIFLAEKRYVDRLSARPITETATLPTHDLQVLFRFGEQSRIDLKEYIASLNLEQWDLRREFTLMNRAFKATPRKIITHVLLHEIRHWAQIGTLLRLNGFKVEFHDFLFSPVMGSGLTREGLARV